MNKQELIDKQALIDKLMEMPGVGSNSDALETIKRFPAYKPQKPVVPECVGKDLDTFTKGRLKEDLVKDICLAVYDYSEWTPFDTATVNWCRKGSNLRTMIDAIWNGYEVEKEPLYYVDFINDGDVHKRLVLDHENGKYNIVDWSNNLIGLVQEMFTESEIKAIDERYWAFAVPVEEVEEG